MRLSNLKIRVIAAFSILLCGPLLNLAAHAAMSVSPAPVNLKLSKGQYLSIVLPEAKPGASEKRNNYYKTAFPLGEKYGLKREMTLIVDNVIISDYTPSAAIFYSFPDKLAEASFSHNPKWPPIKALRSEAWEELKIYSSELQEDVNINFNPDKSYTLVVAWLDPRNPDDYKRYLDGITDVVSAAGGRFIYIMKHPTYEAQGSLLAPGQLTFVEWDTLDGFATVRASEAYKAATPYFASGTRKVEFYRLSVPEK